MRSTVERVDRSYRSLRVAWPVSWRLRWSARADRRAGLPIGLGPDTTPVLRALLARHDDVCERERTRYYAAVAATDRRLAELTTDLVSLARELERRRADVVRLSVRPSEERLAERRAGEEAVTGSLVRQRRLAEHRRAVEAARTAFTEVQERLDAALAEQARLEAERQNRADIARSRVLRYGEHTERLAAIYRRALVRRHPQRDALVSSWRTDICRSPAWVTSDDLLPASRALGGAS